MRITTLLRCYPTSWRERYEGEMIALLEEHQVTFSTWVDLLRGVLDARIDPAFAGGRGPMKISLRKSELVIFCCFVAYVLAGIGFQKMTEDVDKAGVMRAHVAVGIGYYAVIAGAVVAALAIAAGAVPLALGTLRGAIVERRHDLLGLLAMPVVLFVALIGWGVYVAQSSATIHSGTVRGLILFMMVAALLSAASLSLAVSRAEPGESALQFARVPAVVASLAMLLSLIGVVLWGLSLRSSAPSFFALDGGSLRSYAYFTWLRVVIGMGLATLVALVALWRSAGSMNDGGQTASPAP